TDRNHFHPGLSGVPTQAGRADAYRTYVMSGLAQPHIVGVHWFQYVDQAISGRSDGENYNAGFVDITDQPYTELTETARELGEKMYELRAK
ncbi:MAG: beta-agarase, partial [Planctomycetota bacterium]